MAAVSYDDLYSKLTDYKKKYYGNRLLRGCIVSAALLLTAYLGVNTLEYFGQFSPWLRGLLFFAFIGTLLFSVVYWIVDPLLKLYNLNQPISDEEAALQIGRYFTEVNDKLLNAVQLRALSISENELLKASIHQKTQQLSLVNFSEAVNFRENQKYLKYVIVPLLIILGILIFSPGFFTESSARIVHFNREYVPAAPFSFVLKNTSLTAFKNEDLTVKLDLRGKAIPEAAFIVVNGRQIKMNRTANGSFAYTFSRVQNPFGFTFEAAGFSSAAHQVDLIYRPSLLKFNVAVTYPPYLNRKNETFANVGNLVVPEGSQIQWKVDASQSDSLLAYFDASDSAVVAEKRSGGSFVFEKDARRSQPYQIRLKNKHGYNKEEINYNLEVVPDQFPKINVEQMKDTSLFSYIALGGNVSDDYGLTRLSIHYKVTRKDSPDSATKFRTIPVGIQAKQIQQNFYYQWDLKPFKLSPGDKVEYFAQVWDNDGVNGSKSTRSANFVFQLPTKQDFNKNLDQVVDQTEGKMSSTMRNAEKLNQEVNNLKNRLKTKKSLDFQDKKALEDLINKREEMMREIESLRKQVDEVNRKRERFNEPNSQFAEKVEKLQKLMDDLLDEETKKLYEELQKLLEQNRNNNALDLLEKIDKKESNFEKEIERALEMFKQLQFEQKLEQDIQDLKQLSEKQQKLGEQSLEEKKADEQKQQELQDKQQELNKEFEDVKKSLEELKELNQSLEQPNPMENTQPEEQQISEQQQKSTEQLEKENNKKAAESQKNASKQMKSLADKLSQIQSSMGMEQQQENMDHLRDILENLITLSFDQEQVMKDFRSVYLSDPRFVKLSQQQLKLKDDAKIIEDSLYSLAKRVFQIESFVTREVSEMKEQMDGSTDAIKQRRLSVATGKQQLAMTSMNNLALMLNDVLKQMQEQMANAQAKMGQKQPQKGNKPSNLSQLQQQLNQQIQQLKQGNKSGRALSEELAKLAAQQELIRRALKEMEKGSMKNRAMQGKGESGDLQELMKKMEETEKELVNKNVNEKTVNRQKEILTRLLDSEKAMKEQEEEQRREAERAKDKERLVSPSQFNEYIKLKEKQTELLNTIPPALSPYYRKEVDKYFEKIN